MVCACSWALSLQRSSVCRCLLVYNKQHCSACTTVCSHSLQVFKLVLSMFARVVCISKFIFEADSMHSE